MIVLFIVYGRIFNTVRLFDSHDPVRVAVLFTTNGMREAIFPGPETFHNTVFAGASITALPVYSGYVGLDGLSMEESNGRKKNMDIRTTTITTVITAILSWRVTSGTSNHPQFYCLIR